MKKREIHNEDGTMGRDLESEKVGGRDSERRRGKRNRMIPRQTDNDRCRERERQRERVGERARERERERERERRRREERSCFI